MDKKQRVGKRSQLQLVRVDFSFLVCRKVMNMNL